MKYASIKHLAYALATALAFPTAALAATPVAVWDGDFTAVQSGYTLNLNGNQLSSDKSTITINQSVGVTVDFTTGFSSAMTVIFKYSNLSFNAQKTIATSFCSGNDENRTGVYLASGGTANGIWNTADWGNAGNTLSESSGVLAFYYPKATGTGLYYISSSGTRTQIYFNSSLKGSNDAAINGCAIGGERAKSGATLLPAATGMKITGIAIFDSALTEVDMTSFVWGQTISIDTDTSISAINAKTTNPANLGMLHLEVADGVTIVCDTAFAANAVQIASDGSIKLSAASQPPTSYFSKVDFSGVSGAVLRSWLTPDVVGINFAPKSDTDTSCALIQCDTWISQNGASATESSLFSDGISVLKWSASNTYDYKYAVPGSTSILAGYLDDGNNNGKGAEITLSGFPYNGYDVIIYASTDAENTQFLPKTVNGVSYTWDDGQGKTVVGSSNWGASRNDTPTYGVNAIRVNNLSGALSISGGAKNGSIRGGIAAVQIVPAKESFLTLNGGSETWSGGAWVNGSGTGIEAPTGGSMTIDVTASTTLTIDETVSAAVIEVRGSEDAVLTLLANGGSLDAKTVRVKGGVLQQGSAAVLGSSAKVYVANGGTFDLNGQSINAATSVYLAGAGAGSWPWALTSSGGVGDAIRGGLYLSDDATIGGANELKIGEYSLSVGYYCYLQGHTITKTGNGAMTCHNMNTPGTGTIDVQGGAMSVNSFNNLNNRGGDTTVILHGGTSLANGTDRVVPMGTLKLLGGTLSTSSKAFMVNTLLVGSGETANLVFADGASASLTGDLTVTSSMTLNGAMAFNKDANTAGNVAVTASGSLTASGAIALGAGVTFNIGTSRPAATFTVDDAATISIKKASASDVPQINVSSQPANIVLYDENGDIVSSPTIVYDSEKGTLALITENTWTAKSGTGFDTAANWSAGLPSNGDSVTIQATADTEITVTGTYTLDTLTISGPWQVSFAGSGSIAATSISVKNGAKLLRNGAASVTAPINLDAGAKLLIDSTTESAVISGAGSVETYGNVTMAAANTFTGGITAKTGTLSTTVGAGFGGKQDDGEHYVTVEDGACLDIANTDNYTHSLTIAGKGILSGGIYSGAVKNSGNAYGVGMRQTKSITLSADAMVDVSTGWGIVRSGWGVASLVLNGHTLTMRGTGTVPLANVNASSAASAGTLILDGATLLLGSDYASNLSGVNIVAKGCLNINIAKAPSALGSLTISPTTSGTTATAWNLPSGFVPVVNAANIAPGEVAKLGTATLFTAPSGVELSDSTIHAYVGGRYTATISGNTVSAVEKSFEPFIHYDFNAANSIAADSTYKFGNLNPTFKPGRNGKSGWFKSDTTPYWDSNTSGLTPVYAGQMTATAVLKPKEASNTIVWNFGSAFSKGIALVVRDSSTMALVSWDGDVDGTDLVSVTGIDKLTTRWHMVTVVADANGTTLYVDDQSATTDKILPIGISAQGQFGSIHGKAKNYNSVGANGFYLDDWRLYDAALTPAEANLLYVTLLPQLRLILR